MVGRLLSLVLVVLVLQFTEVRAEKPPNCQAKELPTNNEGVLRAFEGPDSKEVEVAAKRMVGVFIIVVIGFFLFLIFWVYFYEPKSGLSKPTEVKRGENYVPYQRPAKEPENTRYNLDE